MGFLHSDDDEGLRRLKKLSLGRISVTVRHGKVAAEHCSDCGAAAEGRAGKT